MLQEFVKRARREARAGEEIPVTDEMFTAIRQSLQGISKRLQQAAFEVGNCLSNSGSREGLGSSCDCGARTLLLLNERELQVLDLSNQEGETAQSLPDGFCFGLWFSPIARGNSAAGCLDEGNGR